MPNRDGIAADFVEGDEAVVGVEDRVLDALGHGRTGQLLEAGDELLLEIPGDGQREQVAQELEQRRLDVRPLAHGFARGDVDVAPVGLGHLPASGCT